jgi:tetratricopeptide (TPR) repeat protein
MKKTLFAILASGLMMLVSEAQTIQEGIGHLYADRFQSAAGVFQKLLAQNPNNIEAAYWLGQTYFDEDKNEMAKDVYQKALASSNNAPLMLVGMGHFLLTENKINEARQNFETAITMSKDRKGKDNPDILNAIGRAHTDAKSGDYKYAEQILKTATELNAKNPDYFLNLGNAIRKARPGEAGRDSYKAYQDAINLNSNFAYAYVRIAKLFETQRNWELVLENLNKAVSVDPNFSLAHYELFYYYFARLDFANAESFFNKYVGTRPNEDKWEHDFLNAQLCYIKKDYDCAITKGESVRSLQGAKVKPRVLRLLAYAYLDKKDFAKAKAADDEFFAKEKDGFNPADYKRKAEIAAGSGVPCDELFAIYMQGAAADTVLQDRIDYMVEAAKDFEKRGCKKQDADMRLAVFQTRKNPNPLSLINIGILYTQTDQLLKADSIFSVYTQLSPDSILGHYWRGRVNASIDTSQKQEPFVTNMVTGFTKALDIAGTDKPRYRNLGITSALSLIGYYYNVKADKDAALVQVYKGLEFDTSHAQLKGIKETLERKTPVRQQGGGTQKPSNNPPKASGAKPEATNPKSGAASGTKR